LKQIFKKLRIEAINELIKEYKGKILYYKQEIIRLKEVIKKLK